MQISPEEARRELARRELARRREMRSGQPSAPPAQQSDPGAERRARVDEIAQQAFGKPFSALSQHERREIGASSSLMSQGATFGFMDEAVSGANALTQGAGNLLRSATGRPIETTMGEAYRRSHDLQNTAMEQRRDDAPILSALTEATGGFLVGPARAAGAAGMAALGGGASVAPAASRAEALARTGANVARGAGFGAAGGAAYGAGAADDGERVRGAQQGALIGGAVGAAAPIATAAGGAITRGIRQPRGDQQLIQAGQRAGLGPDTSQRLASARPDDFVAEAIGGRARRVAQGVPGLSEDAAKVAGDAIADRQSRRFARLIRSVREVAQDDGTRASTRSVRAMREAAKPMFRQVDENVVQATPAIRENVRALRRAGVSFADADRLASLEGDARVRLSALADDADLPNDIRLGDIRALVRQAESNATREFRSGDPQLGRAMSNRARALRNSLKDVDPNFREASRLWHSAAQDEQALELGRDVFSGRAGAADDLQEFVGGGLSSTERQAFLEGVSQAIESRAAKAAEQGGNAASRFNPRYIRDRLRLVFGNDADQITGLLDELNSQASFENMALRGVNSATAGRNESRQAAGNAMRQGTAGAIRDIRGTLGLTGPRNALADMIEGTPDQASADIARLLYRPANPDDEMIQKLIQAQRRRASLFGRAAPDTLPAYAGAGAVSASD